MMNLNVQAGGDPSRVGVTRFFFLVFGCSGLITLFLLSISLFRDPEIRKEF